MPKIKQVKIKNYKSIKNLTIEFNELFGLVGGNSSGKSNILKAINFVLGESWPMVDKLSIKDYYCENNENHIVIEIYFDSLVETTKGEKIKGVWFSTKENTNMGKNGLFGILTNEGFCYINGEDREKISVIYVPACRNFDYHFSNKSSWSLMGKIILRLNEDLSINLERTESLKTKFLETKEIMQTDLFNAFETSLSNSFDEHVLPKENSVKIEMKSFDPKSLYKNIEIIPSEFENDKNIDQLGDGMKNLIFISMLRAYASTIRDSTIFLIEEPEIYLHPQGRDDLFDVFCELSKKNNQLIYTTHSQEFISVDKFLNIGIVRKKFDLGTHYCTEVTQLNKDKFIVNWKTKTGNDGATLESINEFLDNSVNSEVCRGFFAKKIILVEGQSEKWLLEEYAKKLGISLAKKNVEIISTNGKNNIQKLWILFNEFGYITFTIFDGDKLKNDLSSAKTNKLLLKTFLLTEKDWPETQILDNLAIFEDDLEKMLSNNIENYANLADEAKEKFCLSKGTHKEIIARYVAKKTPVPEFIKRIFTKVGIYNI